MDDDDHSASVDAWLQRGVDRLDNAELVAAFAEAFAALWRRAHQTLGEVTLGAIVERVLYVGGEQFPHLAVLKVGSGGIEVGELRAGASVIATAELVRGIRFVLVELLTVLGNLTADILTPGLHAELEKIDPSESRHRKDSLS